MRRLVIERAYRLLRSLAYCSRALGYPAAWLGIVNRRQIHDDDDVVQTEKLCFCQRRVVDDNQDFIFAMPLAAIQS